MTGIERLEETSAAPVGAENKFPHRRWGRVDLDHMEGVQEGKLWAA